MGWWFDHFNSYIIGTNWYSLNFQHFWIFDKPQNRSKLPKKWKVRYWTKKGVFSITFEISDLNPDIDYFLSAVVILTIKHILLTITKTSDFLFWQSDIIAIAFRTATNATIVITLDRSNSMVTSDAFAFSVNTKQMWIFITARCSWIKCSIISYDSYAGWIPSNFKTFIFEPKLSFLRKNHKNDC